MGETTGYLNFLLNIMFSYPAVFLMKFIKKIKSSILPMPSYYIDVLLVFLQCWRNVLLFK